MTISGPVSAFGLPPTGGRHDIVEHLCPECGGDYAANHGALIVVQTCWACHGTGRLTDDQLTHYVAALNRRAAAGTTG